MDRDPHLSDRHPADRRPWTTPGLAWFPFPLGGWAVGLAIHGLFVFLSTSGLRERAIAHELRKLEATPGAR